MKTVAFIPIKTNNERLPGKNTKCFFDGTPLMHFIQKSLAETNELDEIYVYSSDESISNFCLEGVKFMRRPGFLDDADATPQDIMESFISAVDADVYVTAHATSPFVNTAHINECIKAVKEKEFDSSFTAQRIQKLLWDESRKAVNFNPANVPRTQDLPSFFAEVSAVYVYEKSVFTKYKRRVGMKPYIVEVTEIESVDIDWPEDFMLADAIYKEIIVKRQTV